MSGFDVQLRSDALTMPLRQRGAELEGQALAGIGSTAIDTVRWMQENARQDAETDARLRLWATDRALKQQQLMEMQAIDVAEQGRLQIEGQRQAVESARIHNQQAQLIYDQKQRESTRFSEAELRDAKLAALHAEVIGRDPLDAAKRGYVSKPGAGGLPLYEYDPEKAKDEAKRFAELERSTRWEPYGGNRGPNLDTIRRTITALEEAGKEDEAQAMRDLLASMAMQMTGGTAPAPAPAVSPKPGDREPGTIPRAQEIERGANIQALRTNPILDWSGDKLRHFSVNGGLDEQALDALSQHVEALVKGGLSADDARQWVARQVQNDPQFMADVLMMTGYSDEQIEWYFEHRWKLPKDQLKGFMASVRAARKAAK